MSRQSAVDQAGPVRDGEEFDIAAVDAFLKRVDPDLRGLPAVSQFAGGASNLTYLLSYPQRELVLRRAPFGRRPHGAHDMLREAEVMRSLKPVYPLVPAIVATCNASGPLDTDFYVMERIRGVILRRDPPAGVALDRNSARALCSNVIDRLIDLHAIDYRAAGLDRIGHGDGYARRQIEGWSNRYMQARTPDAPDFSPVMEWLREKMPLGDSAACVIHNDFRFDNVVLDSDRPIDVAGVLDWEMATIGNPLMDLGNSLAYWVQADDDPEFASLRRQPTHLPGMFSRREVVEYYAKKTGLAVDNVDFYLVYGLFRLAVIVQQIYFRFVSGNAKNPQFASFVEIAHVLQRRCRMLMRSAAVSL